jgi:hypothetical protein
MDMIEDLRKMAEDCRKRMNATPTNWSDKMYYLGLAHGLERGIELIEKELEK